MAEIGQYAEARSLIVSETDLQYRFELLNAYIAGLSNSASIAASDLDWLDIEVASYRPLTTNTEIRLLSQMGRIDNALALARNAREPQERAHLLSAISSYLMPTGNIEAAKSALLEAEACLKQNGLYGHSERRMYGYSFKKLGAYREAFDLVLSLPVKDRHQEMAYLADDLVKSGRLDDALQALNHVPRHHPDYSGTAAYVIAACQRDGRPFSAKAYKNVFPRSIVIQAMMDTPVPPAENPVVAQAMLDVAVEVLGRPKRIFRWPGDLIEDVTEEGSYVELASAFARLGRLDTAISLIERIKSPFDLAYAHASFAAELVPQGRKSLAGEFADNAAAVGLKDYPISGYYGIVRILAEASLLDQALRLYRRLYVDPEDYPEHFRDISAMLAGRLTAGYQFPNALEIVERCQSPEDRTAVWLGIYEALYTAGASHLN
ncbi:hypothetical protein ABI_34030 [Asticcacaulis biprosthecium C19]|uniref:Tetratricopeptide repeat family protein n=2 Tax=Asticcacaulis biprosthecium TaxID=76891 RepID=F4QQ95_9CAUL|nr:hypothetical protein ABI_34030 [Asticcacaulis biprosthecium C19]